MGSRLLAYSLHSLVNRQSEYADLLSMAMGYSSSPADVDAQSAACRPACGAVLMSVLRTTIRHDGPRSSILAYLDGAQPTHAAKLVAYLWLMHRVSPRAARGAIYRLLERGGIEHVQRGVYRVKV